MRVLISCVGSAGDVHPFLALGQALVRRGHEVELLTSPHFRARTEGAGLRFVPLGSEADYERIVQVADLWHPRRAFGVMWREMLPRLRSAFDTVSARIDPGRTVLVGSTLAWHMRLAQEVHRLPGVTVHLSPLCVFSALAPARLPGWCDMRGWPPALVRAVHLALERGVIDREVAPGLDALRRDLGLAPVRRILSQWAQASQRVVCAWPAWFAPAQADWPTQALTTDFLRWAARGDEPLDAALEAFLAAGPPPVGFTPGSAMAHGRRFFEQSLAACELMGQRALLITPYADQLPRPLPDWARAVAYAPFDRLLPRLQALVHHGGIGTGVQAMAAGLPQGLVPFAHDQFDNTQRWVRLGVGRRLHGGVHRWAADLQSLLGDAGVAQACARLRVRVGGEGAGDSAAQRLAEVIEAVRPR